MRQRIFNVISTNKRERTITVAVFNSDGQFLAKYRTIRLDSDTFRYYTNFATIGDWEQFMKTDEYYKIK